MNELEGLLNKSSNEQKKGITNVINNAFAKEDIASLEEIIQYGYLFSYL